jgi:hypothetical protein
MFFSSSCVEALNALQNYDVDAALTKRRADRRRRIGGAGRHLQLDIAGNFLSHDVSLCSAHLRVKLRRTVQV